MSTVGLSFGSATSGTGFDVSTTVASILALSSGVETPWKTQLTTLQSQDTALSTLGTNLSSLSSALSALTDFDGVLAQKQGSSSDTNVLALTAASSSAVAGSHTVVVNSLAQTSSQYTNALASASDTLSGSLTIQVGSGTAKTITIGSSTDTLATLVSAINQGSYGVTASVVTDTNGSRLQLVSGTSGTAGALTLTSNLTDSTASSSLTFSVGQQGEDASLTVDGLSLTSGSNTVSTAIAGVTFQLLSAAAGTAVQVQITNDNSAIETDVQSFVTAYNAVVSTITTQEGKDSSGDAEPLYGSPTLALVQSQLSSGLLAGAASGSIKSLTQLGLTLGQDGTLSLDTSTLDSALNSNFSDVAGFLQGTGSFGLTFSNTLDSLGSSSTTGAVSLALAENASTEKDLNANITNEDALLATQKTQLTTELTTANEILQSIPEQLNEVNEMYSAITGYNTGNS